MANLILVGIGGFIGASSRYYIGNLVQGYFHKSVFPVGTIAVNLIGCLLIGFLAGFLESRELISENIRLLLFIGILGGFTTFSAFGFETVALLNKGQYFYAFGYVGLSVVLGLLFVWGGHFVSKAF